MINKVKQFVKSWFEWQDAKAWANVFHPSWVQFATQRRRPEIQETYRKKILNGYRNIF
jgi:hypothetical protein